MHPLSVQGIVERIISVHYHDYYSLCFALLLPSHFFYSLTRLKCVPAGAACDLFVDCLRAEDELQRCANLLAGTSSLMQNPYLTYKLMQNPHPAVINFNYRRAQWASFTARPMTPGALCPETHFRCAGKEGYCLLVYLRCNGVDDCPGREDEAGCEEHTCTGWYRCRGSLTVCLHPDNLCDDVYQCPLRDDELNCNANCPESCTCYGLAYFCTRPFRVDRHHALRFLEARGTGLLPGNVTENRLLVHLGLALCGLHALHLPDLPNLHSLDLADNRLSAVTSAHLSHLKHLRRLSLAGNPLVTVFGQGPGLPSLRSLRELDLSGVVMTTLNVNDLSVLMKLQRLNLSHSGVRQISADGFEPLTKLQTLDLQGCPLSEFPRDIFKGLSDLQSVHAINFKLCCPVTLPDGFNSLNCNAPSDEISSCEALLRSNIYRGFLAAFAVMALVGNLASIVVRTIRSKIKLGFDVFVTNLCLSDFLMGLYLPVIGVADRVYLGSYLWEESTWRHSAACQVAGFLSLLSSEVSALIVCLITVDRFLVLRFPFSQLHFSPRSALVASLLVWLFGLLLALLPLLPATAHWQFYSQTGICIPLPVTRNDFPGRTYTFGVMIVLNFVLFLLIALGQGVIYYTVKANSMKTADVNRSSKDIAIARRLITVAMSDFLCWFPIGLLGLLASNGVAIPGEVSVAMAIFALPLNSAINPFLYTLNMILERSRLEREERLRKFLLAQLLVKGETKASTSH